MAASFSLTVDRETSVIAGIKSNARASAAAEAGLAYAEMMLLHPDQNKRWHTDGSVYEVQFQDALVRVRLLAESGKIDINMADQKQLTSLMLMAPVEEEERARLVGAIIDWRDPDDLVSFEGAEKQQYQNAKLKYQPRNKPFQSVEELQMVLGMNEAVLNWLMPRITVYSGSGQVDSAKASREVLLTLPGIDPALIDQYLELRRQSAINGTPMQPFSLGSALQSGSGSDEGAVEIASEALLEDGSQSIIKAVIVKNISDPASLFQILNWQSDIANDASLFSEQMNSYLVTPNAKS